MSNPHKEWVKLDTAAQLFPATSSPSNSSVFRLAVVLTEQVKESSLTIAAQKALNSIPSLNLRLRKGFFKRYFEYSKEPIKIEKEKETPCQYMNDNQLTTHLMRILYHGNRISIEVHHTLGDGLSLTQFLTTLLSYYFDEEHLTKSDISIPENISEDSYIKYAALNHRYKANSSLLGRDTFHLKGTSYPLKQTSVIHGHISLASLKEISKQHGVTINTVLIAILILAIQKQTNKQSHKKIKIAIPVNLRTFFPSHTIRNFFGVTNIIIDCSDHQQFSKLLMLIDSQLKNQLQKKFLLDNITKNVVLENNSFSKNTPLILREQILKMGFKYFSESNKTLTVSNLGIIKLPKELEHKISHFEAIPYPTIKAPISCGVLSYKEHLVISFIKNIEELSFITDFFSIATSKGLDVFIHGNDV